MKNSNFSDDIDLSALGEKIAAKRKREGLGLREAADQCGGVSYSTLSRMERGAVKPDLETLQKIVTWLDIAASSLFRGAHPVRAHLRAQKNFGSVVAQALAEVVQVAQATFYHSTSDPDGAEATARRAQEPYRKLRSAHRENLAVRLREMIKCPPDGALDPFTLEVTGVDVKRIDEIPGLSKRALAVLTGSHRGAWSAITLPLDDAESRWLIILNSTHTIERQRVTLMEEICHILLGHHLTSISHVEGQSFRDYNRDQETDAYGQGAAILLPREALLVRVRRGDSAEDIGEAFGVSQQLVEYRIKVTGGWYEYTLHQRVTAKPTT
jgi:transcriptional regulator with XRE-family HTH domain